MIEVVNLDLLHHLLPLELRFSRVLNGFRFLGVVFARYPFRRVAIGKGRQGFLWRLRRVEMLLRHAVRMRLRVMRTLHVFQLYLVHLVLFAEISVPRPSQIEAIPELPLRFV